MPALKEFFFKWQYTHNIGIRKKQKELTKTFVMISNFRVNVSLAGHTCHRFTPPGDAGEWPLSHTEGAIHFDLIPLSSQGY